MDPFFYCVVVITYQKKHKNFSYSVKIYLYIMAHTGG